MKFHESAILFLILFSVVGSVFLKTFWVHRLLVYHWNALWPLSLINKNLGMVSYWGKQYYFIVKSLFSNWGPFHVFRVIKFSSFSGPSSHSEDLLVCENNSWWIYFCRKPLVCANRFYFLRNCYFHFYKHALLSTNAWKQTEFSG